MSAVASQITSVSIVSSTVCSGADQRKIKAPHHWPLCGESTDIEFGGVVVKFYSSVEITLYLLADFLLQYVTVSVQGYS